jgi:NhaP-type Na+/H+ or K+/H+ antiporter/mannitol/fructose-specific phosphotransferase system IIA component (Ntr-type)
MVSGFSNSPLIAAAMGEGGGHGFVTTLSFAIGIGAFLMVVAKRMRIPGIVLLLFGGITLGPEGWNIVHPEALGSTLNVLVSLAVGIILFEGGLTLNLKGYRTAGKMIRRLLTVGVVITWLATAGAIYAFYRFEPLFCLLSASLVIVTGPTVIQPILKRIRLKWNLHHTLHWEGVLIDPIGVFAAVLAFEWVLGGGGEMALFNLGLRVLGGLIIGFVSGELICLLLRHKTVPEDMINAFMLGAAVMVFGLTEALITEGGLLSVTVAGLVVGARQPPEIKAIVEFKSTLVDLLIGFVFILLTARLELSQFFDFGIKGFALVATVMLVVRPLAVFASSAGLGMSWRDRVFLGWVAPRGVVAASMASLFALSLESQGRFANPDFLETFVYSVIFTTVILQGFSAGPLAWLLRIKEPTPEGWLIVGAHPLARAVARFLRDVRKVPVALIDGNRKAVLEAQGDGLTAIFGDARESDELEDRQELQGIGRLLAFTDNEDLNELLCKKWESRFKKKNVYRWASTNSDSDSSTGAVLWSWMPKPSMISSEILLGEAALTLLEGERMKSPGSLSALLTANSREVLLDPGPESKLKIQDKTEPKTLYLQREADYLLSALSPECVLRLDHTDHENVIRELTESLATMVPEVNAEETIKQVVERERVAPTLLGHGIAVPHVKLPGLSRTICAIGQSAEGVSYENESESVRLVFLLLSPVDEPEMHLAVLGEVARLCADAEVRRQMIECEDLSEMIVLIRRYRRQHTAFADVRG